MITSIKVLAPLLDHVISKFHQKMFLYIKLKLYVQIMYVACY